MKPPMVEIVCKEDCAYVPKKLLLIKLMNAFVRGATQLDFLPSSAEVEGKPIFFKESSGQHPECWDQQSTV
jgi:hypothetical protein